MKTSHLKSLNQRNKKKKKSKEKVEERKELRVYYQYFNIYIMGIPECEVKRERSRKFIWRNNGPNFPSWRGKQTYKFKKLKCPTRINPKRPTLRHIIYISVMQQEKDPFTFHTAGAWGSLMCTVKENKRILIMLETGKAITMQVDKPGTDCMDSLFLSEEVFLSLFL